MKQLKIIGLTILMIIGFIGLIGLCVLTNEYFMTIALIMSILFFIIICYFIAKGIYEDYFDHN